MKIVFMGTPDFAACSLQKLIDEKFDVKGVFCQPDRPKDRGHKLTACPVKLLAEKTGIAVYQPEKLRDGTALAALKQLEPDMIVVVAYGRILPPDILNLPKYGCINVHGSLLPKYRGSAPIQWAVLNGEDATGVTTMHLAPEMDTGDIIYSQSTPIGEYETSGELFERLAPIGAELLVKTIRAIEDGTAPRIAQEPAGVSFAPPLTKDLSPIDWNRPPKTVVKQTCGLQPWPCATAELGGVPCKIFRTEYTDTVTDKAPGAIVEADKQGIQIACAGGHTVRITELQAAGGKRMSAAAYLLGHPFV
jgi:methionyl-tRNA formyltransferase